MLDLDWLDDIELPDQGNTQTDGQNDGNSENENQSPEKEPDYSEKLETDIASKLHFASV